jgi:hypothetical protein
LICCLQATARSRSSAFAPLRGHESLLFACPKRSNQEKGHPGFPAPRKERARGTLRCSESVGRRELAHPCAQTVAPFPAGFFRYSAENERGLRANSEQPRAKSQELAAMPTAASLAPLGNVWHRCARHLLIEAGAAVALALLLHLPLPWRRAPAFAYRSESPHRLVPSSGARAGGKARMFEHMDVRVRAGPVMVSSAGDRASSIRAARDWGVLLFGYFLLDKHEPSRSEAERRRRPGGRRAGRPTYEKVTRCAQRREGS